MNLAFREFRVEASQIAGFHDGRNLNISPEFLQNDAVRLHEQIHGRIFSETPDGRLHVCLIKLKTQSEDQNVRKKLEVLNARLFSNTRLPHERAATFLGIIGLPTLSDIAQALATLPREYKEYYSFFDHLCCKIPTTFVRYSVAWGISRRAFCSLRLESINDLDDLLSGRFLEIPGPAARLSQIARAVDAMGPEGFSELVETRLESVMSLHNLAPFDYRSEDVWKATAGQVASQRLERLLIEEFEKFSCSVLGEEFRTRFKIPTFLIEIENSLLSRRFNHDELPIEDGKAKMSPEAVKFYSRETDTYRINRPGLGKVFIVKSDNDVEFILDTLSKARFDWLNVSIVPLRSKSVHFSMFITGKKGDFVEFGFGPPIVGDPEWFNQALAAIMVVCDNHPVDRPNLSVSIVQELELQDMEKNDLSWGINKIYPFRPTVLRRPPDDSNSDSESGIAPYFYTRGTWSATLATTDGTLVTWRTLLKTSQEDEGSEFVICILYPENPEWVPYLAVMTGWCLSRYLSLMSDRIRLGKIRVVSDVELPNEISRAVTAIWSAFRTV